MRIQELDYSVDLLRALLWQYNEAPNLEGLLTQKQAWYNTNQSAFWQDWERDVFNLETANDFGLAVWAIILNAPVFISVEAGATRKTFGFGVYHENFNRGNFSSGGGGSIAGLTMEQSRLLLRLRYFNMTMRPSVSNINAFMNRLFADMGTVAVLDNHDMTCTYAFLFKLPSVLEYVFSNWETFDALPRPAGVSLNITTVPRETFGFGEFHANFNNGNFGE